jgi:hypothetical protein
LRASGHTPPHRGPPERCGPGRPVPRESRGPDEGRLPPACRAASTWRDSLRESARTRREENRKLLECAPGGALAAGRRCSTWRATSSRSDVDGAGAQARALLGAMAAGRAGGAGDTRRAGGAARPDASVPEVQDLVAWLDALVSPRPRPGAGAGAQVATVFARGRRGPGGPWRGTYGTSVRPRASRCLARAGPVGWTLLFKRREQPACGAAGFRADGHPAGASWQTLGADDCRRTMR